MLKQIAVIGDPPAINCNVSLYEGEQNSIAEAFVHLSRHTAKKSCKEFVQQTKQLIPVNLKFNGKADWDSTLDSTNNLEAQSQRGMRVWKRNIFTMLKGFPITSNAQSVNMLSTALVPASNQQTLM